MDSEDNEDEKIPYLADKSKCMAQHCDGKPATYAPRITFVFNQPGFRNKTHVAYLELFVCDEHATQESAEEFRNIHSIMMLGLQIGGAIGGRLDYDKTVFSWEPRAEADKFFARVNEQSEKESAARRSSIMESANDPTNIQ